MTHPPDVEHVLDRFYADGPTEVPDRVIDAALLTIDTTEQRRAVRAPWRTHRMLGPFRMAAVGAAALLITLLTVANVPKGSPPAPGDASSSPAALPPTDCPAGTVLPSGSIATIAGTGDAGSSGDGGPASDAAITLSYGGLAVDPVGAIYFGDQGAGAVRRIGLDGIITTYAGPGTGASFLTPDGLALSDSSDLFVTDLGAGKIWKVDPSGAVSTAVASGPAITLAIDAAGDLYWDGENQYQITDPGGTSRPFAGTGTPGYAGDGGLATDAELGAQVLGVAVGPSGEVYLGDPGNFRLRKVDPSGIITTVAGTGTSGYTGDGGPATKADIGKIASVAADDAGNVYFVDKAHSVVRKVDPAGIITTVAGTEKLGFSGDCGPATEATLSQPFGVAVHNGIVYIGDEGNRRIRMVVP